MDSVILLKHELFLVLILVILLIVKISGRVMLNNSWITLFNVLMTLNCVVGFFWNAEGKLFGEMFVNSDVFAFEKNILNVGSLLICLFSAGSLSKHQHLCEFYFLMIASLLGMFFMISSSNLLMFFLAIELSAIPLAALSNFSMGERRSSEAAMKMIFSSAFSSCIMLLGISFLYGASGSLDFIDLQSVVSSGILILGFVFFFVGMVFKLSVVPFHFWTADVYEGSPVAVTAFLSVISKGSMVFVICSILYKVFPMIQNEWYLIICLLSILTMITGNLFAIRQENLKRFLAFSSITQVGFILIGISGNFLDGMASSVYFIIIYIFSNLGAFAVISRISELTGKENISEYRGLHKTNPGLAWMMAISLFSLAGIPPTAGFFGKIFLLTSGASGGNFILITIAALNMIVSLYYYLRVVRAMFMDTQEDIIPQLQTGTSYKVALAICITGILLTGFFGNFYEYIYSLGTGL